LITKAKYRTPNLFEVDELINAEPDRIFEIGETLKPIVYIVDGHNSISFINETGRKWLNLHAHPDEQLSDIAIDSYFQDQIIYREYYEPEHINQHHSIKYNLQKVWFHEKLDFKLCLVSCYPASFMTGSLYTIVPLKDWGHLKNRLVKLIEEEEFMQLNADKYEMLTKREKEVVKLIAKGLNSREISDRLFISKHTVEQHRKNTKRKLGISSLAELVKYGKVFE